MSTTALLTITVLSLTLALGLVIYMLARAVNEVMWLRDDQQHAHDTDHAKCMAAVMQFVGDEWAAQVLDIAADDYASVESQPDKDRIGRLLWRQDGDPVPSIWLRERADRLRIMAAADVSSIIDAPVDGVRDGSWV